MQIPRRVKSRHAPLKLPSYPHEMKLFTRDLVLRNRFQSTDEGGTDPVDDLVFGDVDGV